MITAHPLIQVHLIAPQLLLWIALPHHGDIMLATNYLSCRCYSVPFGQHADETENKLRYGIQFSSRTGVQRLARKDSETSETSGGISVRAFCKTGCNRILERFLWASPERKEQANELFLWCK